MAKYARRGNRLTARTVNAMLDDNRSNRVVSGPDVLVSRSVAGTSVDASGEAPPTFWIRLDAAGTGMQAGRYSWTRVTRTTIGGWAVTGTTGSLLIDFAYEANGFADLTVPFYVEVRREIRTGRIVFQDEACS